MVDKVDKIITELVKKGITKKDIQDWYSKSKTKEVMDKGEDWIDKKIIEMNMKRR